MKSLILAGAAALALSTPALADIAVHDAYARSAMASAKTGAAFMVIENTGDSDDRLIGVMPCTDADDVFLATRDGKAIRFKVTDVRVFQGRDSLDRLCG